MAAPATAILDQLSAQLSKFIHAMDYAPGMDQLGYEEYSRLRKALSETARATTAALASQIQKEPTQ